MTEMLEPIYKVGVVIGIFSLYSLFTWGLGAIFMHDQYDTLPSAIMAWLIGAVAFLILAVYTLSLLGRWG